jgi:predicted nucleic acid-binding protein
VSSTAVDTSVLIAALCTWHEAHVASLRALGAAERGGEMIVPVPALLESYAVMTRLPSPHRLAPEDAHRILSRSLEGRATVVGLSGAETWRLLRESASGGVAGGSTYDAAILACARRAGADRVLTLDRRDFVRLAPEGLEIVVP